MFEGNFSLLNLPEFLVLKIVPILAKQERWLPYEYDPFYEYLGNHKIIYIDIILN